MSSQNTFGEKVRLNDKVESRVRGDLYARFGGECLETYHCNKWQGAGCLAYGELTEEDADGLRLSDVPLEGCIDPHRVRLRDGGEEEQEGQQRGQ